MIRNNSSALDVPLELHDSFSIFLSFFFPFFQFLKSNDFDSDNYENFNYDDEDKVHIDNNDINAKEEHKDNFPDRLSLFFCFFVFFL